jgi:uncharacterized protein (DUF2141 family)
MIKNSLYIFVMLFSSFAFSQEKLVKLNVEISKLRSNKGNILLQLTDSIGKLVSKKSEKISDNKCTLQFNELSTGKYALRYFHDENANDSLDTNWMGIPKEGYGFSNNAIGMFGPPSYNERLFDVRSDMKISLKPKY